jgi:hypothetical protein
VRFGDARFTGVLLAAVLLASCAKTAPGSKAASGPSAAAKPAAAAPAPEKPAARPATQPPQAQQPSPKPQQPPQPPVAKPLVLTKETAPASGAAVVKKDRGLLSLYSLDPRRVAQPEDFRIGPLSGAVMPGLSADEAESLRTATSLLSGLSKKKVAEELLLPERKEALSRLLGDAVSKGLVPTRFRLGPVGRNGPSATRVNARLYGSAGSAEGELFLRKEEKSWLIADIQLRFESLAEKQVRGQERFYPSTFRWLLDEF